MGKTIWRTCAVAALVCAGVIGTERSRAQTFPGPGEGAYTWERIGDDSIDAQAITWNPSGQLVGTTIGGVATLTGDGPSGTWSFTPLQFPPRRNAAIIVLPDGATLMGDGLIDWSSNGLPPWTRGCGFNVNDGECEGPRHSNAFFEIPPGHAHAGRILAGSHNYSDDHGFTWTVAPYEHFVQDPPTISDFALLPSGRILASADGWGFLSSDDGGASWQNTTVYAPYRYVGDGITALATPGSVQSGAPACGLPDLSLCEGALAIGTDATDLYNRTWWTNDGGRSWTQGQPLQQLYDGCCWNFVGGVFDLGLDPETGLGRSVAILGRGFIFATRDGGQTWRIVAKAPLFNPDADGKWVGSAVLDAQGRLYVAVQFNGTGREWVYRTVEPVTAAFAVAGEAVPEAKGRVGITVRPNPAGGRVEVVLHAVEAGVGRVVVVDALGREVAVVLDDAVAAGETPRALETGAWPAGVYVVRASVGTQTATARLVVAR